MRPILAAVALLFVLPASAQTLRYPVKTLDFDIWCTEVAHLSGKRCDARRQEDVDKFEAYRHTYERYEIQHLRDKENVLHFDDTILNNDPVDKRPDSTIAQPPSPVAGH